MNSVLLSTLTTPGSLLIFVGPGSFYIAPKLEPCEFGDNFPIGS